MKRSVAATAVVGSLFLSLALASPAGSLAVGVAPGTPVHAHIHDDNGVVSAIQTAARAAGLGPVTAVGFERDCRPNRRRVVVCRDKTLDRHGNATFTTVGPQWCVVRLEPTVGAGPPAVRAVTAAFRRCIQPG